MTADAELQEKSSADVKFIVDTLLSQCSQAVRDHDEKTKDLNSVSNASQTQPTVTAAATAAADERMSFGISSTITMTVTRVTIKICRAEPLRESSTCCGSHSTVACIAN